MKEEISAAVNFLTCLVDKSADISAEQAKSFQASLGLILTEKFQGHWFPDQPYKGQAYRCIRVNSSVPWDSVLEKAAKMCGLRYESLKLPLELTIWVDPQEVCCRFGENDGSFFTIASFKGDKENMSNNVQDDIEVPPALHHVSSDPKRLKITRRKIVNEHPKKQVFSRTTASHINIKGFMPKLSFNSKHMMHHSSSYFDWNPAVIPISSRITHSNGYSDLPVMRRPRKVVRSVYLNDHLHWLRK